MNVDNTAPLTSLSLCAGYGGIDLGLKRVIPDLRIVAYSEIEAFAIANLVAKMEAGLLDVAPVWSNLKTFPWASFRGRVWIVTGGYPCQPFSHAGQRKGQEDERHLWPYILAGIRIVEPEFCFFENVEGHITLGLSTVISDLEEAGYRVEVGIFSAAEIGAGHQRKRVFILAHRREFGSPARFSGSIARYEGTAGVADNRGAEAWPSRPGEPQHEWEPPRTVANRNGSKRRTNPEASSNSDRDESGRNEGASGAGECGEELADATDSGLRQRGEGSGSTIQGERSQRDSQQSEPGHAGQLSGRPEGLGGREGLEHATGSRHDRPLEKPEREARNETRLPVPCPRCGELADTSDDHGRGGECGEEAGTRPHGERRGRPSGCRGWRAQLALGRDADGTAYRLDYAELCSASDNRTDELRLLGNGVLPTCAELAFVTLLRKLIGGRVT